MKSIFRHGSRRIAALSLVAASLTVALAASGGQNHGGVRCRLAQLNDSQQSFGPAFTYFVPKGWNNQDSLNWNGNVFTADIKVSTPDQKYVVRTLEPISIIYGSSNGKVLSGVRLTSASDFLRLVANQLQQQGHFSNFRLVSESSTELPLDDLLQKSASARMIGGMRQSVFKQAAFIKVSFEQNGVPEVANIATTVGGTLLTNNMALGFGKTASSYSSETGTYVAGPTLEVIMPQQPSSDKVEEARVAASSVSMTPQFGLFCAKRALEIAHLNYEITSERGRQLIRDMREHSEKMMDDFKQRMAERDAHTRDFCNFILDQQDFRRSDGAVVTLPAYYDHAWSSDQGDYILTNNVNFDPRGTDQNNWNPMNKVPLGEIR